MCCKSETLIRGAVGLAKAATGIDRADRATIATRRARCQACPEAVPCVGNIGKRCVCQQCGCLIRAKTALASEKCPLGKW
jgi:hypothetical protein